jgi:hypothetical protein
MAFRFVAPIDRQAMQATIKVRGIVQFQAIRASHVASTGWKRWKPVPQVRRFCHAPERQGGEAPQLPAGWIQ